MVAFATFLLVLGAKAPAAAPQHPAPTDLVAVTLNTGDSRFQVELAARTTPTPSKTIWRDDFPVTVRAAFDEHHVLIERRSAEPELVVVDTRTGKGEHLIDCPHGDFVHVYGQDVVLWRHHATGRNLVCLPWRGGEVRTILEDAPFGPLSCFSGHFALAIGPAGFALAVDPPTPHLLRVDLRDGSMRKLATLSQGSGDMQLCQSPTGQRIAISSCMGSIATLDVFDFATGKLVRRWTGLAAASDRFLPTLPIEFRDDDLILAIESHAIDGGSSWRAQHTTRSISSGEIVEPPPIPRNRFSLQHVREPSPHWLLVGPDGSTVTRFEGDHAPREVHLAPDGSAVILRRDPDVVAQLLRRGHPPMNLPDGFLSSCEWLTRTSK